MSDNTYNGWQGDGTRASAYATWRIGLELVNDRDDWGEVFRERPDERELADHLEEYVNECVFMEDPGLETLVSQYAAAFLDDVSWRELAEHILLDADNYWLDDEDDDLSCNQCEAAMINGVYCHEHGCPNRGKVKIDGAWVTPESKDE